MAAAQRLLADLGVLDADGRVTAHGRDVAAVPAHPRLAHLLLRGRALGAGTTAARLAALLGERDVLAIDRARPDADLVTRVAVVDGRRPPPGATVRRGTLARVRRRADRLARGGGRDAGAAGTPDELATTVGVLTALGFPDRIAVRRAGRGRFVLANGRGVSVDDRDPLADAEVLVATDVDDRGRDGRLWTGAATALDDLLAHAPDLVATTEEVVWDDERRDVVARRRLHVGAATLREDPLSDAPLADAQAALLEGVRRCGLDLLPWGRATRDLRARASFVAGTPRGEDWPALDDDALLADLDQWLAPFLGTARRRADLARVPLADALAQRIGWERARQLDELAPTHLPVPSGRSVRVDYADPHGPVLAVKLQEMFGATRTPTVAGVPVVVHLLSPAGRPLQVTSDLPAFWAGAYGQVRAEMRGRYPKHPWPEDPTTAVPTARTRRRQ